MPPLPVPARHAVIGLGPMGLNHVRAMGDIVGARLVAVVDLDAAKANDTARAFHCEAVRDIRELPGRIDTATVATPPEFHAAVALPLLRAGIPCLIEKPLAMTPADCSAIIAAARDAGVCVAVGHVERFNPAVEALLALGLAPASIRTMTAHRLAPAGGRHVAVDIVSDMMVHDLDVVLALKPDEVAGVSGVGETRTHAHAGLSFADGATASLQADRKADARTRTLVVETADGAYHLDFMARTLRYLSGDGATVRDIPVVARDALRAEIADFLDAARSARAPRVDAAQALRAMRVAWRILERMDGGAA